MARPKFVQTKITTLKVGISASETTEIILNNLVDIYGNNVAITDYNGVIHFTLNPGGENEEVISCTGFTRNSDGSVTLDTGITRGLAVVAPYASGGRPRPHSAGTIVIVADTPHLLEQILDYIDEVAIQGGANMTTTSAGFGEKATATEIDNDDDEGSVGPLVLTPDQLALSKYGLRLPSSAEKTKLAELLTVEPFAGDGSDGALEVLSGTTTLDLSIKTVWQFTSVNIEVGATLTFSNGTDGSKLPVIKCQGNFTNAGTITTVGKGPAGGSGGAAGAVVGPSSSGSNGTAPILPFSDTTVPQSGRAGQLSTSVASSGSTGGAAGAAATKNATYFAIYALNGAGGGGGGGGAKASVGTAGAGGAGGAGSLGLYIEIGGNFSNSGSILLNGEAGTAGQNGTGNGSSSWGSGGGGGGGGGGAGSLLVYYRGTYSNSGTITANGGAGGSGGACTNLGGSGGAPTHGGGGGGGSGGATSFNTSVAGSAGVVGSIGNAPGGSGGAGGGGIVYIEYKP